MKLWKCLFRRGEQESALEKELQFHVEERVADLKKAGLAEQEARRRVRLEFGGIDQVKEECREVRGFRLIGCFVRDFHFALRSFRKNPGFVVAAIATLALGIGANTAIFSLISAVLLRPLPFFEPDRLVQLNEFDPRNGVGPVIFQHLENWRKHSTSFEGMFTYGVISRNFQSANSPERITAVRAETGLFQMLGVQAALGRIFRYDDPPNVAVISNGFWRRRFGGDQSCIGTKVMLDEEPYTVIGVMPAEFRFPYRASPADVYVSWTTLQPAQYPNRRAEFVIARMKKGITMEPARVELDATAEPNAAQAERGNERSRAVITPLSEVVVGSVKPALLTLFSAVAVVLLIACANVTNLLLAHGAQRRHELALRIALGASRRRLIQQLLTESVLISIAGAAAGLILASFCTKLILRVASSRIPRVSDIGLDWRVFAFLLVAAFGSSFLFGLLPAIATSQFDVTTGLKSAGRSAGYGSSGWSGRPLRNGLVIAEIAMAFMLVIGAGTLLRAFLRLEGTPPGFEPDNLLTLHMGVSPTKYQTPGSFGGYLDKLETRLNQIAGVQNAGFIQYLPLENWGWWSFFSIREHGPYAAGQEPRAELRFVSAGYFNALHIPIRSGRIFNAHDTSSSESVVLINEALARRYFPNENPVGQQTDRGRIIGVVGDVRHSRLDRPPTPEIYYSFTQNAAFTSEAGVSLVVRSSLLPEALVNTVRNVIHQVNPNQTIFGVRTMRDVIADSLRDLNLYVWLVGIFAGVAMLLAIAGIYGVVSYVVGGRSREFAIRLALGAKPSEITKLVLGQGSALVASGLAAGVVGALAFARTLKTLSSTVTSPDTATLLSAGLLLSAVALAACLIPARHAARIDPNVTLKYE